MYLGIDQPAHSLRTAEWHGEEVVLIGGEGHKTGQGGDESAHYEGLERFGDATLELKRCCIAGRHTIWSQWIKSLTLAA